MKTYPIRDANNRLVAIEVENAYIGVCSLADAIGSVQGVSNVSVPRPFSGSGDVRATFSFSGHDFLIVEPFGDNSRYWIGPVSDTTEIPDLSPIEVQLKAYKPPMLRKFVGDVITLNFKSLFGGNAGT